MKTNSFLHGCKIAKNFINKKYPNANKLILSDNNFVFGYWCNVEGYKNRFFTPIKINNNYFYI